MNSSLVYAIILSGGSGNRFGTELPKQFAEVHGKSILYYCINNFENHPLVDKIIVVGNPEHIQQTKQIVLNNNFKKIVSIVEGGITRGESSYIGLKEISNIEKDTNNIKVLIQDAVRPNTQTHIISEVIEKLDSYNAVTIAVPVTDTIYIADSGSSIQSIPDRNKIYKAQTPQGFNYNIITSAYEQLEKEKKFKQSDDICVVNLNYPDEEIAILNGDNSNIKITFIDDIEYFRQILKQKKH
ncbi:MAG: 2-C-methyl-D-erythritol 4-phosphate cytidylyltransferase [Bacteroidales bacterium]|jgi:2-C-methyl-D-erythritol 4-phosphate cytidylyltransferase|nr:2-C-methyl-D-erythritol 4-phosphate cytidylyltransferase [Bacteroidales bacterium]